MKTSLKATPNETAALVSELQERLGVKEVKLTDHEVSLLRSAICCKITITERYIENLKYLIKHGVSKEAEVANEINTIEELSNILQKLY